MPPVPAPENKIVQREQSTISQNFVSVDVAQKMADEAASKALSEYNRKINSGAIHSEEEDINLDKQMKRVFLNKMNKPSFGETLADHIDNQLSQQVVAKLIPNLFGSDGINVNSSKKEGVAGFIMDILNTQFAYGAGQTMGASATEIIKTLGKDRIGKMIDRYNDMSNSNGQQITEAETLSPEEQQRRTDNTIMSLDSTDQSHVQNFMQATGITSFSDAQRTLLVEQDRILQSRGLVRKEEVKQEKEQHKVSNDDKKKVEEKDINRELIDKYENSNPGTSQSGNSFFDNNVPFDNKIPTESLTPFSGSPSFFNSSDLTEKEFILSLNPDDPISQQEYVTFRKISGVPQDMIKKMLIKEQNKFRNSINESSMSDVQPQNETNPMGHLTSTSNLPEIKTEDEFKPMKKEDFYKEIGLGKTLLTQKQEMKSELKSEINQEESVTDNKLTSLPNNDLNNIMIVLQNIGNSFEKNMQLMNEKIGLLENEITVLKSKEKINISDNKEFNILEVGKEKSLDIVSDKIKTKSEETELENESVKIWEGLIQDSNIEKIEELKNEIVNTVESEELNNPLSDSLTINENEEKDENISEEKAEEIKDNEINNKDNEVSNKDITSIMSPRKRFLIKKKTGE